MADEFDAEAFCRELVMAAAYWSDGPASRREKVVADFAARLRPHLADRRAVEGLRAALRDVKRILTVPAAEHVPAIPEAWSAIDAALAAAGEGE